MSRDEARTHHESNSSGRYGTIELGKGIGSNMILAEQIAEPFTQERERARHGLERDDGERPEVGPEIDVLGTARLLGAHVKRRPHEQARFGHAVDGPVGVPLGNAEIEHLGDFALVVGHEKDVFGFEIAVNDADSVRARESSRDVRHEPMCRCRVESADALESPRHRFALQEFHRDVRRALPNAVIEHVHDVRAAQLRFDFRFALEARHHLRLPAPLAFDELHRAGNAEPEVRRKPHRSHSALPDLSNETEAIGNRRPFAEPRGMGRETGNS